MSKKDEFYVSEDLSLSISIEGLKGKQSVRTTFRLPEHIINLLGAVASQLGLKQKSLFDQLIEDKEVLYKLAQNVHNIELLGSNRRQKTFVLSRRSLKVLESVAKQQRISRDVLVEISIQRLLPMMNEEHEKHRKRTLIYKDMEKNLRQARLLLQKTEHLLGKEDKTYELIEKSVNVYEENFSILKTILEKGKLIEDFVAGK